MKNEKYETMMEQKKKSLQSPFLFIKDKWSKIDCDVEKIDDDYLSQFINKSDYNYSPNDIRYKYDRLYTLGDVDTEDEFYIVKICYMDECNNVSESLGYICNRGIKMLSLISKFMKNVPEKTNVMLIYVKKDKISGKYKFFSTAALRRDEE